MGRGPVTGTKTMVVSPHYLASAAGAEVLAKGGNAYDAAVAVSAALAVVYPHMTGLGGDAFWLGYSASEGRVRAYNGSGRSGYAVRRDCYAGEEAIPRRGVRSAITVPGMADSWEAVQREYGRLTLAGCWSRLSATAPGAFRCRRTSMAAAYWPEPRCRLKRRRCIFPAAGFRRRESGLCSGSWPGRCGYLRREAGMLFIKGALRKRSVITCRLPAGT